MSKRTSMERAADAEDPNYGMNCWHCSTELIWGGDHDYEDYGLDGEGIVSNLSCPNCHSFVLVHMPMEDDKTD